MANREAGRPLGAWREQRALPLLVAVPAVALAVLAGSHVVSSAHDLTTYQHAHYLAETGESVAGLAQALEAERTDTATFVTLGPSNGGRGSPSRTSSYYLLEKNELRKTYSATDKQAEQVVRQVSAIGGSYPAEARARAHEELTVIRGLGALRHAATETELNGLVVGREYSSVIQDVLGFNKYIAPPGGDAALSRAVQAFYLVSQMKEEVSSQAAILISGLTPDLVSEGALGPDKLTAITSSMAAQRRDAQEFAAAATTAQAQQYESVISGAQAERAATEEQAVVATASSSGASAGPTGANASTGLGYQINGLRALEVQAGSSAAAQAGSRRVTAEVSVAVYGALLVALVVLAGLIFLPAVLRRRHRPAG